MTHPCVIFGSVTEAGSQLLLIRAVDKSQSPTFKFTNFNKLGSVASGDMITASGINVQLSFHSCDLVQGASPGLTMTLTDTANEGRVNFTGQCFVGCSAYTLSGFQMLDYGTNWGSMASSLPVETLTGTSTVQAFGVSYGGIGPITRLATHTITTLTNGTNVDIDTTYGNAVIYVSGPTGSFSFDGFAFGGAAGQKLTIFSTVNQQLTVKHLSSSETTAANKILTPTGADLVIAAPGAGGYILTEFIHDGTNWRYMP
jgi:hypothetical protein